MSTDWLLQLENQSRNRFAHWHVQSWHGFVDQQLPALAQALAHSRLAPQEQLAILQAYAELAAEAHGAGYVSLENQTQGHRGFFSWMWLEYLPHQLPDLTTAQHALDILSQCWNLCENLQHQPSWIQQLFLLERSQLTSIHDISGFIHHIEQMLGDVSLMTHGVAKPLTLHLQEYEPRFVPHHAEFLTPNILQIIDVGLQQSLIVRLHPHPVILATTDHEATTTTDRNDAVKLPNKLPPSLHAGEIRDVTVHGNIRVIIPLMSQRVFIV